MTYALALPQGVDSIGQNLNAVSLFTDKLTTDAADLKTNIIITNPSGVNFQKSIF
jgi:hypothetical protein